MSEKNKRAEIILMDAVGFDLSELGDNRQGYMSIRQRKLLELKRSNLKWLIYANLLIAPLLVIVTIVDGIRIHDAVASRVGIIILILTLSTVAFIYFKRQYDHFDGDLYKGSIESLSGKIFLRSIRRRDRRVYYLRMQDQVFEISRPLFEAIKNGKSYTVYYSPNSRIIMSLELTDE